MTIGGVGRAREQDIDHRTLLLMRNGVGIRRSADNRLVYDLLVIANDTEQLIRSAGGWMCDRSRAGWQVTAVLPVNSDIRSLHILGVRTVFADDPYQILKGSDPAALAVASDVMAADSRVASAIERLAKRGTVEVSVWGGSPPDRVSHRFTVVRHSGSAAARAFKSCALALAGPSAGDECVEEFHSVALWYPSDGNDLVPVRQQLDGTGNPTITRRDI